MQTRLGYTLERYECPAAAKARQLRQLAENTVALMQKRASLARASKAGGSGNIRRSIRSPPPAADDMVVESIDDEGGGDGDDEAPPPPEGEGEFGLAPHDPNGGAGGVVYLG